MFQIVDSTTLCDLLPFLDTSSSHHQTSLVTDNEEKASFIAPFVIFCYKKMAFDLKNGGATC
jgi:hypothetical protein